MKRAETILLEIESIYNREEKKDPKHSTRQKYDSRASAPDLFMIV